MRSILLFVLTFLLASCSDFNNTRTIYVPSGEPSLKTQPNPFPPGYEKPNTGEFTEEKMLVNIGVNVIAEGVDEFALQTKLLSQRVELYCEDLQWSEKTASEQKALNQWKSTMLAFHYIEAFPVGPLSDNRNWLHTQIYSWPYIDTCGIDLEVIRYSRSGVPNKKIVYNQKGLAALEYLLFEPKLSSQCNPRAYPQTAKWSEKSIWEKKRDRCHFAQVLAKDLVDKSQNLLAAWSPEQGNFSKTLIDGSHFKSVKEATNALTDALFSIEKVKDNRLGKPLGRHKDCSDGICPQMAEHPWSGMALPAIEQLLRGYFAAFYGHRNAQEKAFGLDDFLASQGHPEISENMKNYLQQALQTLEEVSARGDLQTQIKNMDRQKCEQTTVEDRHEPLCALFLQVRKVVNILKAEVLSVLSLRAPPDHQGDND